MTTPRRDRTDKRISPRRKVLVHASLSLVRTGRAGRNTVNTLPGSGLRSCILKDISETGCQVVGPGVNAIEGTFYLRSEDLGFAWKCIAVWWKKNMIGARFLEVAELGSDTPAFVRIAADDPVPTATPYHERLLRRL